MPSGGRHFAFLGVLLIADAMMAAAESPHIWRTSHARQKDVRMVTDRLHARNNPNHQDYSFLNAVGAVWPADIAKSAAGYMASTGFLIDRCHVLTNLHTVYIDDLVVDPAPGKEVFFGVGQTDGGGNPGALQGLKFLLSGHVVAHGDSVIVDHFVHNPENDWALIRLSGDVDETITPLTIAAVDGSRLPKYRQLSLAGFPADRRASHGPRLDLKDMWGSDGELVRVVWSSTDAAVIESTIQASRGNSGGPLYGDFDGRRHLVIGMAQGIRGNGIDVSEEMPNIQVFFTPGTLANIRAAQAGSPCPAS
jgi:V8-like Glu-specific endopeptidase